MDTQNITLSIPKDILLKAKLLAVRRNTSVSGLITRTLESLVRQEDAYARAQQRHLQRMDGAGDLGTGGRSTIRRGELHERP